MKRKLITCLICILATTMSVSKAQPFNLDSLLIASVGGPEAVTRIENMKSFKVSGKVSWNGIEGAYSASYLAPGKFRIAAEFEKFSLVQGYDGNIAWQQDIHGRVFSLSGFERTEFMRNAYIMSFGYLPKGGSKSDCHYVQLIPSDTINFHQVDCVAEPGDTLSILFREDLALPSIYGAYLDNIMLVSVNAEFEKVEGIWFPFYSYTSSPQAPIFTEVIIDTISIDAPVDSSIFTKPNPQLTDFHFPQDSLSVTIPFKYQDGHVTVEITVNGIKKGRFILDTGASASFYHSEFVNELKLDSLGQVPAMGVGGFENLQITRFDSLTFGSVSIYDQTAGVIPLYQLELMNSDDVPFGGLLGYDFFVRFPTQIDFKNQKLKVFNPGKFAAPENGLVIPFHLTMMIPTIKAKVAGIDGEFLVDLGNSFGLLLHNYFGQQLISSQKIDISDEGKRTLGGVGQGVSGMDLALNEIMLTGRKLAVPETILVDPSDGLTGSRLIAGNIGTKVLEQCTILFDYPNQRVILYGLPKTD
jgi:hypothetical protein